MAEIDWSQATSCPTGDERQLERICAEEQAGSSFDDEPGFRSETSSDEGGFDVCAALDDARAGDAAAALRVAGALRRGIGLSRDMCAAAHWSFKAARQGEPRAMTVLGAHFELGEGVSRNPDRARFWYERAASKGDLRALTRLGALYRDGLGVPADLQKAESYFQRAADRGDPVGLMGLADLHVRGEDKQIDVALALQLSEQAARSGHPPAMAQRAALQIWGALLNRKKKKVADCADGVAWAHRAEQAHIALGAALIGDAHLIGCGMAKSRTEAARWYARAIEEGAIVSPSLAAILRGNGAEPASPADPMLVPQATVAAANPPPRAAVSAQDGDELEADRPPRAANAASQQDADEANAEAASENAGPAAGADPPAAPADGALKPDLAAETARRAALVSFALGRQNDPEQDGSAPEAQPVSDAAAAQDPNAAPRDRDAQARPAAAPAAAPERESDRAEAPVVLDSVVTPSAVSGLNGIDLR